MRHRLVGIHQENQHHLLNLARIASDLRKVFGVLGLERNALQLALVTHQGKVTWPPPKPEPKPAPEPAKPQVIEALLQDC